MTKPSKNARRLAKSEAAKGAVDKKKDERAKRENLKKEREKKKKEVDADPAKALNAQLRPLGCKLKEVQADGNCLFRALSDQLTGKPSEHLRIREEVVNFMEEHRDDFEPFMEDDEKFEAYCARLRKAGTWGGNQELCAAARRYKVNITIHQLNGPRMEIQGASKRSMTIHLGYDGSEHYDSVRALEDQAEGVPLPISFTSSNRPLSVEELEWLKDSFPEVDWEYLRVVLEESDSYDETVERVTADIRDGKAKMKTKDRTTTHRKQREKRTRRERRQQGKQPEEDETVEEVTDRFGSVRI